MEDNQKTTSVNSTTLTSNNVKVNALISSLKMGSTRAFKNITLFLQSYVARLNGLRVSRSNTSLSYQDRARAFKNTKNFYKAILITVVVVLLLIAFLAGKTTTKTTTSYSGYTDSRPAGPTVKAGQNLNKEFIFPLLDDKGVKVSEIKYKLTTAELEDSIIVNGQRANAVRGRTFLVINLEITNKHTQTIQINSKDYLRLSVNGTTDWIAPDIHNDPVQVQAISTKITRLGFPINDADKDLTLQVGEIKGQKQFVKLNLK